MSADCLTKWPARRYRLRDQCPGDGLLQKQPSTNLALCCDHAPNQLRSKAHHLARVPQSSNAKRTTLVAKPGLRLVLALKNVPIGNYARQILENASKAEGGIAPDFGRRVLANLKSEEVDVKAVLAKVQLGEADVAVVYGSDAISARKDVRAIPIPARFSVTADYPIAMVKGTTHGAAARAWLEFVASTSATPVWRKYGFGQP